MKHRMSGIEIAGITLYVLVATAYCIALFIVIAAMCSGCATTPELRHDVFPDSIRAQCVKAKAAAIAKYGPAPVPYWSVAMVPGRKVGSQWAFESDGRLCGGATKGSYTRIGCGPRGEINYGDLLHEAVEYVTWQDGRAHR